MKVLVIPDVHLKPQMFRQAAAIMRAGKAKRAVCLMDIPDDRQEMMAPLHAMKKPMMRQSGLLWFRCAWYGNHGLGCLALSEAWMQLGSITNSASCWSCGGVQKVQSHYVQKDRSCAIFLCGGVLNYFVEEYVRGESKRHDVVRGEEVYKKVGPKCGMICHRSGCARSILV